MLFRRASCAFVFALMACSSKQDEQTASAVTPVVDLRADVNRNGTIDLDDPTEDEGEETWDAKHGAIFLANIDDDLRACDTKGLGDLELPKCNDAANETIDGDDDLLDLAPMATKPWADAPADAIGTIEVSAPAAPFVRIFRKTEAGFVALKAGDTVDAAAIARGVELAIEGKDIVRDPAVWDGYVDVTWRVTAEGVDAKDTVRLRVAPVILQHHGSPVERLFATNVPDKGGAAFRADLDEAVSAARPGVKLEALPVPQYDPWMQDLWEGGYMAMPGKDGTQHVMRVLLRGANHADRETSKNVLRQGGKIVFTLFRGKDVAGIQEFDPESDLEMDSLDSYGNTETIPPFEHGGVKWPLGRIVRGSIPSFHPDAKMSLLIASQKVQEPVLIDTSWLLVGHVDETVSFLPLAAPAGPRSFLVLANDARLAKSLLEAQQLAGHGSVKLFVGKSWIDDAAVETSAERSIDDILADPDLMAASQGAAASVDAQLAVLKDATGLEDSEIVPVPFLHMKSYGLSVAYQPGTVNGVLFDATHFASPRPHGPVIDGRDVMEAQLETELGKHGVTVSWVEDWDDYHRMDGEVHCGSNVFRSIPDAKWWESGR